MSRRYEPVYWSSCCGVPAGYTGFYRCTGCQSALSAGRARSPHLVSDPGEAARIRQERAAEHERTADEDAATAAREGEA